MSNQKSGTSDFDPIPFIRQGIAYHNELADQCEFPKFDAIELIQDDSGYGLWTVESNDGGRSQCLCGPGAVISDIDLEVLRCVKRILKELV